MGFVLPAPPGLAANVAIFSSRNIEGDNAPIILRVRIFRNSVSSQYFNALVGSAHFYSTSSGPRTCHVYRLAICAVSCLELPPVVKPKSRELKKTCFGNHSFIYPHGL